jgi:hypothetical protein
MKIVIAFLITLRNFKEYSIVHFNLNLEEFGVSLVISNIVIL